MLPISLIFSKIKPALFITIVAALVQLSIFTYNTAHAFWITPPGHTYTQLGGNFFYPNTMIQARDGAWRVVDASTTRPTARVFGYIFFIGAGKFLRLIPIDPIIMYRILQATGGLAIFATTYFLVTRLLPPSLHVIGVLFTLILETGPLISDVLTKSVYEWSAAAEFQAVVERHFGLPHHLWGEAMGLALISIVLVAIRKPHLVYIPLVLFLGFVGTNILPSYFVIISLCVFAPWFLYSVFTNSWKKTFPWIALTALSIGLGGLFIKWEFSKGPPWNTNASVEKNWWTNESVLQGYVQFFTLYYPFVLAALLLLPLLWKKYTDELRFVFIISLSWLTLPIALIYLSSVASWLPIANGRIASDVSQMPVGMLAAVGVWSLRKVIRHPIVRQAVTTLSLLFIFSLSFILTTNYTQQSLKKQARFVFDLYPTKKVWNGVEALQRLPIQSGVMIMPAFGEISTGFANLRIFVGGPHWFDDYQERLSLAQQFFSGSMEPNAAKQLLQDNDISYVFWGPEERNYTATRSLYPDILESVYQNEEVAVFKVLK